MIANYLCSWIDTMPPLVVRERAAGGANLSLAAEDEAYPLRCRTLDAEFGVAPWNRTAAAVLFITAGGVYVMPTITD
jgi:hypothetical protein